MSPVEPACITGKLRVDVILKAALLPLLLLGAMAVCAQLAAAGNGTGFEVMALNPDGTPGASEPVDDRSPGSPDAARAELIRLGMSSDTDNIYFWIKVGSPSPLFDPTAAANVGEAVRYPVDFTVANGQQYHAAATAKFATGFINSKLYPYSNAGSPPESGQGTNFLTAPTWVCNELKYTVKRTLWGNPALQPKDGDQWLGMMANAQREPTPVGPGTPRDYLAAGTSNTQPGTGKWTVGDSGNGAGNPLRMWQSPPVGLSAQAIGDNTVRLSWTPVDNGAQPVTEWRIYRSVGGAPFSLLNTMAAGATSYDDMWLTSGQTYAYQVSGVNCPQFPIQPGANVAGESLSSASVSVTPDFKPTAPSTLAVGTPTATSLKLTWTASSGDCPAVGCTPAGSGASGVQGYAMYRGASGAETFIMNIPAGGACASTPCEYTNTGLTTGATYCYYLRAYDGYTGGPNLSPGTPESCGTPSEPPAAPAAVADTFAVDANALFSAAACAVGIPAAPGGPYKGVLCNDQDAAGDAIQAILVTSPTQTTPGGSFTWDADNKGGFTYRAATDYCGFAGDSFQYQLKDVSTNTMLNTATVQLNIACPPAAVADTFSATINSLFTAAPCAANVPSATGGPYKGVLCNDQDTANHAILALLVSGPSHVASGGSFSWNSDNKGGFVYQADTDYCGATGDSFQYQLKDATTNTLLNTVTVQLDIGCTVNQAPTAACGVTTAPPFAPGQSIAFSSAGSSDSDGTIASWSWTFPSGTPTSASDASTMASWAIAGTFAVTLSVTDDDGATSPFATCNVTVTNTPPTATEDYYVAIKNGYLDTMTQSRPSILANDVDAEANIIGIDLNSCPAPFMPGILWPVNLEPPNAGHFVFTPNPGFVGDATFSYKARDALGLVSDSCATVTIHVQENRAPSTAFTASPTTVRVGEPATFVDASSDPDAGDSVTAWSWNFGDGYTSYGRSPIHIFGIVGTYSTCLQVTDIWGTTGKTACRSINVIAPSGGSNPGPPNGPGTPPGNNPNPANPPTATPLKVDAGLDQTVAEGAVVKLQATITGTTTATTTWTQTYGPKVQLINANTQTPSFTAPLLTGSAVVLYFELTAEDGSRSGTDGIMVALESITPSPVAKVAAQGQADVGQIVILDGAQSGGGNGDSLSFKWTQWEGPAVIIDDATTAKATFTMPDASGETLRFVLEVSDGHSSSIAVQTITVRATSEAAGPSEPAPEASAPIAGPDSVPTTLVEASGGPTFAIMAAVAAAVLVVAGVAAVMFRIRRPAASISASSPEQLVHDMARR